MNDCIFCRIAAGEIPARTVYEDDETIAFLDIAPVSAGHVLVIPKRHFPNIEAVDPGTLYALVGTVKRIGAALKDGLGVAGYNIGMNNDPVAGQVIPHIHFHVIPRREGDGLKLWPGGAYDEGEAEKIAARIKAGLAVSIV